MKRRQCFGLFHFGFIVLVAAFATAFLHMGIAVCCVATADDSQPDDPKGPPQETIELPDIEVLGTKQELALRVIKSGLEGTRSNRHEDRNKPYCWFDSPAGTHMNYLYCGLNRSLHAESRYWQSIFTTGTPAAGTLGERRHVYRSNLPINRGEVESILARLGPAALNDEIVTRAMAGESMPKNVPTETEVEHFAMALKKVRNIRAQSAAASASNQESDAIEVVLEQQMAKAIEEAGLTVERYNAISDMVERYSSLRTMVQENMQGVSR